MIKKLFLVILAGIFFLSLAGCATKPQEKQSQSGNEQKTEQKIKVGFLYTGPVGDAGWNFAQDQGRKYLAKQLAYVETAFVENVPEGADAERVMTEYAEKGYQMIVATSFGYMDAALRVAGKYPKIKFLHCSGIKQADNLATYFGREYEASYLTGLIAGKMTKSNKIGFVAAHPISEMIYCINGLALGAKDVNPQATVKVVWTNTWYDPAAEKQAAESLIDVGCDIIAQHQDSPAAQQAAEAHGVYGIGFNNDMRQFAPRANLTSPVWNWGPYYVEQVKALHENQWKTSNFWGGIKDGVIDIGPMSDLVPPEVQSLVKGKRQQIIDGQLKIFTGPLKDNTGKLRLKEGQVATDEEILNMNWFVDNVEGNIPK